MLKFIFYELGQRQKVTKIMWGFWSVALFLWINAPKFELSMFVCVCFMSRRSERKKEHKVL